VLRLSNLLFILTRIYVSLHIDEHTTDYANFVFRHKNCLLQQVIEGKIKGGIEVTVRRGRRRRKLLDDLKERRGYSHLKEVESSLRKRLWTCRETDCFEIKRQTSNC
jgi:hypothetical protein